MNNLIMFITGMILGAISVVVVSVIVATGESDEMDQGQ